MISMEKLFNLLSEEEKTMASAYIRAYAFDETRSESEYAPLEHILRIWEENKSKSLFKMLGEKLIISKEITFDMPAEELEAEMNKRIFGAYDSPARKFVEAMHSKFGYGWGDERKATRLLDNEYLIANEYSGDPFNIDLPDGKILRVNRGCKCTRMLGKIAAAFDLPHFEEFRVAHSMVLNQKSLKGNLCLSIHPLDFMTMSDNASDWSSCMSWEEYGCYRQGTVEMMNSPVVVVAYLTGSEDMYMPGGFRWNNKKWRELFVVTPEIISNVLAYPYRNAQLSNEALSWIAELATASEFGEYEPEALKYDIGHSSYRERPELFRQRNITVDFYTYQMYNDFGCGHYCYIGKNVEGDIEVTYSGPSECMGCGSTSNDFGGEGCLVCDECEPVYYCAHCDDRITGEVYTVDDETLCDYCYNEHTSEDLYTGEIHLNRNMYEVYLAPKGATRKVYEWNHFSIFEDNMEDAGKEFTKSGKFHEFENLFQHWYFVPLEDVTEELAKAMGYSSVEKLMENVTGSYIREI